MSAVWISCVEFEVQARRDVGACFVTERLAMHREAKMWRSQNGEAKILEYK